MSKAQISGVKSMESNHKQIVMLRCKVVIVGDACVGKSALTQVFHSGGATYPKNYLMTSGAEFCVKQVPIPDSNVVVELYLFDCAGQSIFNQIEMNAKYYENASAVMCVYDIANRDSFSSGTVRAVRPIGPPIVGVLVGNKTEYRDGTDSRAAIERDEAEQHAVALGLEYFETSAAHNSGVEEPFMFIAKEFHRRYDETVRRADELTNSLTF